MPTGVRRTPQDVESQIRKDRPWVSLKHETFRGTSHRAVFIDDKYGEWEMLVKRVLDGSSHPMRTRSRKTITWLAHDIQKAINDKFSHITLDISSYVNTTTKARFVDEKCGEWWTIPKDVLAGKSNHPYKRQRKTSYEIEKSIQKTRPWISLDHDTYINTKTKARFIDGKYGEWWIEPSSIERKGYNHPKRSGNYSLTIAEFLYKTQHIPNIRLDQSTYVSGRKRATFIDDKYGPFEIAPLKIIDGRRHPKRSINYTPSAEEIAQKLLKINPKVKLDAKTYKNIMSKATFIDENYGEWQACVSNVINNFAGHPARIQSNLEMIIGHSLKIKLYNKPVDFCNSPIRPDFKISDSVYLECDGLYWHSEKFKDKWHHFKRREFFEKYNKQLFQFREDEIGVKLPIVLSFINYKLGKFDKVDASKCELKVVEAKEAYQFFEENHLMGGIKLKAYGLFFNNELVQAMSFQNREKGTYVKFCTKLSFQIFGGQSKLLSTIKRPVVAIIDLRYEFGEELLQQGLKLKKVTLGWGWTKGRKTFNRLKCRANMDDRKLTQTQHAEELGWYKIYDAGQAKYIRGTSFISRKL